VKIALVSGKKFPDVSIILNIEREKKLSEFEFSGLKDELD
jgi:hypothetical protein